MHVGREARDMALKAYYTEDEAAALREHLEADAVKALGIELRKTESGKLVPVIEARDGMALEDVRGLRNSVEASRAEAEEARKRLKAFGDIKPEQLDELRDKATKFDAYDPDAGARQNAEQFDAWKADYTAKITADNQAKVEEANRRAQTYREQLETELIVSEATRILADPNVKGNPALLLPVILNQTDTVEREDGRLSVRVLNPAKPGHARIGKTGDNMTLEELVKDELMKAEQYAPAFGGSTKSGASERETGDRVPEGTKKSAMSDEQKALFIRQHGIEAWRALPR